MVVINGSHFAYAVNVRETLHALSMICCSRVSVQCFVFGRSVALVILQLGH